MDRIINIGGTDTKFRVSALTPYIYREAFNSDMFIDMDKLTASIKNDAPDFSTLEKLAYAMAKQADASIPDFFTWLDGFESVAAIYEAAKPLMELWASNQKTTSTAKKA